jgi:transposase
MRYALNRLAVMAPGWLRAHIQPAWFERYSHRVENYRLPKADTDRQQLAATIGADGFALLQAAYGSDAPPDVRDALAVEVLRQIWGQQYYGGEHPPRWRHEPDVPPAAQLIHSPYDLEARYSTQHGSAWVGYKAHATETCDDDTPHIITHVETTPATTPEDNMLEPIHAALAAQALLPQEHLVDCGYTDAETLVTSVQDYGVPIVGPVAVDPSWQAREGTGFDKSQFLVDWDQQVVTCPMGKQSISWHPHTSPQSGMRWEARFARKDCTSCPHRAQCTRAKKEPRIVGLQAREQYEALHAARQHQTTEAFKEHYAMRAGIESTLSQGVRAFDLRRSRYIGLAKTHLQHILIAVGINLKRVMAWFTHPQPTKPYISPFAALVSSG